MSGLDVVNKLIDEGKHIVSDDELRNYTGCHADYDAALMILENVYNAQRIVSYNANICDYYIFDNPKAPKENAWTLYHINVADERPAAMEVYRSSSLDLWNVADTIARLIKADVNLIYTNLASTNHYGCGNDHFILTKKKVYV